MPKAKRVGKVFIDWSQNTDYKTTIGVYSLRAKQQRPYVSMPVTWAELSDALKRKKINHLYFDPNASLARVQKMGDLFADVLTLKQTIPAELPDAVSGAK
jgi:bifunctional non-homologous end joining protein LigD